jgi:hypothetical protein
MLFGRVHSRRFRGGDDVFTFVTPFFPFFLLLLPSFFGCCSERAAHNHRGRFCALLVIEKVHHVAFVIVLAAHSWICFKSPPAGYANRGGGLKKKRGAADAIIEKEIHFRTKSDLHGYK